MQISIDVLANVVYYFCCPKTRASLAAAVKQIFADHYRADDLCAQMRVIKIGAEGENTCVFTIDNNKYNMETISLILAYKGWLAATKWMIRAHNIPLNKYIFAAACSGPNVEYVKWAYARETSPPNWRMVYRSAIFGDNPQLLQWARVTSQAAPSELMHILALINNKPAAAEWFRRESNRNVDPVVLLHYAARDGTDFKLLESYISRDTCFLLACSQCNFAMAESIDNVDRAVIIQAFADACNLGNDRAKLWLLKGHLRSASIIASPRVYMRQTFEISRAMLALEPWSLLLIVKILAAIIGVIRQML